MYKMQRRFRRIFAIILLLAVAAGCCTLTSCGQAASEQPPRWIQLRMPDGNIVEGYGRFLMISDFGGATVTINGVSYYTHICNIVECSEKP